MFPDEKATDFPDFISENRAIDCILLSDKKACCVGDYQKLKFHMGTNKNGGREFSL